MYPYGFGASKLDQKVDTIGGPFGSPVIFSDLGPPLKGFSHYLLTAKDARGVLMNIF